jgi:hypothetical protein
MGERMGEDVWREAREVLCGQAWEGFQKPGHVFSYFLNKNNTKV